MKKNLFRTFVCTAAVAFASVANAATEKSLNLIFNSTDPCKSLSLGFSISSDHTVKGTRGGKINQSNHGVVGECALDEHGYFYTITGALTNSQWGPTAFHGWGIQYKTPKLWRLSVTAGLEGAATYYEQGCPQSGPYADLGCMNRHRARLLPLPMAKLALNIELGSARQMLAPFLSQEEAANLPRYMQRPLGKVSISVRRLGAGMRIDKEHIDLTTVTIEVPLGDQQFARRVRGSGSEATSLPLLDANGQLRTIPKVTPVEASP
jgi:hypothetical protein